MSSKVKSWLLLTVIFVVGIVTGAALTVGLASHFLHPGPGMQQMKELWMMHLNTQLNLTADQQAKIQPLLNEAGNQIQALHREEVGRSFQIIKTTDEKISAFLTPEQKVALQKMESEREQMFIGRMRGWGPGPHGGPGGMPPPHGGPGDGMGPRHPWDMPPPTNAAPNGQ